MNKNQPPSFSFIKGPDTAEKLAILSRDAQYDLACACAPRPDEHRRRSQDQKWVYPVSLPSGGRTFLFKTLLSNTCSNNCRYCPLRKTQDIRRLGLQPAELAKTFLSYYRQRKVSGLFLSSGVLRNADTTMSALNESARILRRSGFRGYIHLKVIPGASEAAIRESLSLATAVSLNIEVPGEEHFRALADDKHYSRDILGTIDCISRLRMQYAPGKRPHQTTQFIVGAGAETDNQIVAQSALLYKKFKLNRVYFSAYQRGAGDTGIPGERSRLSNEQMLIREHRLYQTDWLLRKYGFSAEEIPFEEDGSLSLEKDPKEAWAERNPQFFPVNINTADRFQLMRIPGFGAVTVDRILSLRQQCRIRSLDALGTRGKLFRNAKPYTCF